MKTCGIVCEYNPFHSGHVYQIRQAREQTGADCVICLMSGNAVQRGELPVADAYTRAEMALCGGADLVFMLPFPYCCASARFFAGAAVEIFTRLGVETLHFGSECGDLPQLQSAAVILTSETYQKERERMGKAAPQLGSMVLAHRAYRAVCGQPMPTQPNDLLALAYLCAIREQDSAMKPYTCQRVGMGYHERKEGAGGYPSAAYLREILSHSTASDKNESSLRGMAIADYLPRESLPVWERACIAGRAPVSDHLLAHLLHFFILHTEESEMPACREWGGGVLGRLRQAAFASVNWEETLKKAATKKFTDARLRRAALFALERVTDADLDAHPTYVQLLGTNSVGRAFLSETRKKRRILVVTKPADVPSGRQALLSNRLDRLYALSAGLSPTYFSTALPVLIP